MAPAQVPDNGTIGDCDGVDAQCGSGEWWGQGGAEAEARARRQLKAKQLHRQTLHSPPQLTQRSPENADVMGVETVAPGSDGEAKQGRLT